MRQCEIKVFYDGQKVQFSNFMDGLSIRSLRILCSNTTSRARSRVLHHCQRHKKWVRYNTTVVTIFVTGSRKGKGEQINHYTGFLRFDVGIAFISSICSGIVALWSAEGKKCQAQSRDRRGGGGEVGGDCLAHRRNLAVLQHTPIFILHSDAPSGVPSLLPAIRIKRLRRTVRIFATLRRYRTNIQQFKEAFLTQERGFENHYQILTDYQIILWCI